MMKIIKNISKVIVVLMLTVASYTVFAQPPPPPEDGGLGGNSSNKLGGNAPIGGGTLILLGLGVAYGGRKVYYQLKDNDIKEQHLFLGSFSK